MLIVANPATPTHRSGTEEDAIPVAMGSYIPDESLPGEAGAEKETETAEYYSVFVTPEPLIRDHCGLVLKIQTPRLNARAATRK